MYFYSVGHYSWEESHYEYLTHEISFDEEEFTQAFLLGCVEAIKSWLLVPAEFETHNMNTYSDITKLATDWLVANRGFSFLKVHAEVRVFGWNPITPESFVDHSGEERTSDVFDEHNNKQAPIILNRLRDEGLISMIEAKTREMEVILNRTMEECLRELECSKKEDRV